MRKRRKAEPSHLEIPGRDDVNQMLKEGTSLPVLIPVLATECAEAELVGDTQLTSVITNLYSTSSDSKMLFTQGLLTVQTLQACGELNLDSNPREDKNAFSDCLSRPLDWIKYVISIFQNDKLLRVMSVRGELPLSVATTTWVSIMLCKDHSVISTQLAKAWQLSSSLEARAYLTYSLVTNIGIEISDQILTSAIRSSPSPAAAQLVLESTMECARGRSDISFFLLKTWLRTGSVAAVYHALHNPIERYVEEVVTILTQSHLHSISSLLCDSAEKKFPLCSACTPRSSFKLMSTVLLHSAGRGCSYPEVAFSLISDIYKYDQTHELSNSISDKVLYIALIGSISSGNLSDDRISDYIRFMIDKDPISRLIYVTLTVSSQDQTGRKLRQAASLLLEFIDIDISISAEGLLRDPFCEALQKILPISNISSVLVQTPLSDTTQGTRKCFLLSAVTLCLEVCGLSEFYDECLLDIFNWLYVACEDDVIGPESDILKSLTLVMSKLRKFPLSAGQLQCSADGCLTNCSQSCIVAVILSLLFISQKDCPHRYELFRCLSGLPLRVLSTVVKSSKHPLHQRLSSLLISTMPQLCFSENIDSSCVKPQESDFRALFSSNLTPDEIFSRMQRWEQVRSAYPEKSYLGLFSLMFEGAKIKSRNFHVDLPVCDADLILSVYAVETLMCVQDIVYETPHLISCYLDVVIYYYTAIAYEATRRDSRLIDPLKVTFCKSLLESKASQAAQRFPEFTPKLMKFLNVLLDPKTVSHFVVHDGELLLPVFAPYIKTDGYHEIIRRIIRSPATLSFKSRLFATLSLCVSCPEDITCCQSLLSKWCIGEGACDDDLLLAGCVFESGDDGGSLRVLMTPAFRLLLSNLKGKTSAQRYIIRLLLDLK